MKNLKKWLAVLAAFGIVLLLAGCPGETPVDPNNPPYNPNSQQQYTVTFRLPAEADLMSGPGGGGFYSESTVNNGERVSRPVDPNVAGFIFENWYADSNYTTLFDFNTPISGNTDVYAKMRRGVKVTFDANDSTANFEADQAAGYRGGRTLVKTIEIGGTVTRPANTPLRGGYVFMGWYSDQVCSDGNEFDFNTTLNSDTTIYAKWVVGHLVTFETNGGSAIDSRIVQDTETTDMPNEPTKDGYNFDGWYSDRDFTRPFSFTTPIRSAITIYAKWKLAPLTVGHGLVVINADSANTISAMYACDHEVTMEEFKNVFSDFSYSRGKEKRPFDKGCLYTAIAYCNKLSLMEGKEPCYTVREVSNWQNIAYNAIPTTDNEWTNITYDSYANGYRLPTKEEWIYLAKGGENYTYSGSENWRDVGWFSGNSGGNTHDVKTKAPNGYGIYDMSGNLGEIVWTWNVDHQVWSYGGDYNHTDQGISSYSGIEYQARPRSEATFRVVLNKPEQGQNG